MAPEVYLGIGAPDWKAADMWSFGVTLMVLLTRRLPWLVPSRTDHNFRRVFRLGEGCEDVCVCLQGLYPGLAGAPAVLLAHLLCLDPSSRWTVQQTINFFSTKFL